MNVVVFCNILITSYVLHVRFPEIMFISSEPPVWNGGTVLATTSVLMNTCYFAKQKLSVPCLFFFFLKDIFLNISTKPPVCSEGAVAVAVSEWVLFCSAILIGPL